MNRILQNNGYISSQLPLFTLCLQVDTNLAFSEHSFRMVSFLCEGFYLNPQKVKLGYDYTFTICFCEVLLLLFSPHDVYKVKPVPINTEVSSVAGRNLEGRPQVGSHSGGATTNPCLTSCRSDYLSQQSPESKWEVHPVGNAIAEDISGDEVHFH